MQELGYERFLERAFHVFSVAYKPDWQSEVPIRGRTLGTTLQCAAFQITVLFPVQYHQHWLGLVSFFQSPIPLVNIARLKTFYPLLRQKTQDRTNSQASFLKRPVHLHETERGEAGPQASQGHEQQWPRAKEHGLKKRKRKQPWKWYLKCLNLASAAFSATSKKKKSAKLKFINKELLRWNLSTT